MYKANDWHIYETEILEQNDRQRANENLDVVNDAIVNASMSASFTAGAPITAANEFVSTGASFTAAENEFDAAADAYGTENIMINVDDN